MDLTSLITDDMETLGHMEFTVTNNDLFNKEIKEFTLFYKIVGESRIKLFRNQRMELIFVRLNDDWMRQGKIDISNATLPLAIQLKWDNKSVDELAVKTPGQQEYQSVTCLQIDN
ncbi:hypothetical protein [Desulforamulus reducens]|uniref:hypothetical protein n=1 Tax=Desulforamulus reducens TaxID=59610 RepID=UPI0003068E94|nr:hypothetical protein [Desulforamulus reducens]